MAIIKRGTKGSALTHAELDNNFTEIETSLSGKVAKDGTKVLSDVNFSSAKDTKLSGIASGATVNDTDANLKNRANHTGEQTISTITGLDTALSLKENIIISGTTSQYWRGDKTWQDLNKSVLNLGNVDNTSDINKPISTATQTALDGKVPTTRTVAGKALTGNISLVKGDVGLGNVDNTSDANKPISTLQQQALNLKQDILNASNLKTINGNSLLGSGNLIITGTVAQFLGYTDVTTIGFVKDGTTDNSGKFNGTKKLFFPAGTYYFKSTNYLDSNYDFLGEGMGKTIFKVDKNFTNSGNVADDMREQAPFEFNGASNIRFEGISFNGSGNAVPANSNSRRLYAFIKLNPYPNVCKNVRIINCAFEDGWCYGIRFGDGEAPNMYEDVKVQGCTFTRLYDPNHVEYNDEVDNQTQYMKCDGLYLNSRTKKVQVTGCIFDDLSGDGIFAFGNVDTPDADRIITDEEWRAFNFSDNYFHKTWMGIEVNGNIGSGSKSLIHNNIIMYPRRINGGGYGISFSGDKSQITNNLVVCTEMAALEIFGDDVLISDNTVSWSVFKKGSGGVANATFTAGNDSGLLEVCGSNVSIKSNKFRADMKYDNSTYPNSSISAIKINGKSPYSPVTYDGVSDYAIGYDISDNTFYGMNKSFIEATVNLIRKVHIHNNDFRSKNLTQSGIWVQGFDWDIEKNYFDLTGSTNGDPNNIGVIKVHNQVTNCTSRFFDNTIVNQNWGIKNTASPNFLKHFNNRIVTTDAIPLTYILPAGNDYLAVTAAYTVTMEDYIVATTSGTGALTLLSATNIAGKEFFLKNATGAAITVNTTSSQTMDGVTSFSLPSLGWIRVRSNGTNWIILDQKFPVLTGYSSTTGTISVTDTVLTAIGKLNGNDALKAPLASPALTGTPTAPTASVGTNTTQVATTAFVFGERTSTSTLTNKRITKRVGTVASNATITPVGDSNDMYTVTGLAVAATIAAPTGGPTDGQELILRIKDNGTAQTLTWNAIYRAGSDFALPTTTTASKTMYLSFIYNNADTKWDLLRVRGGY